MTVLAQLNQAGALAHALKAQELLDAVRIRSEKLEQLTEDERLQMVVSGGFAKSNRDLEWTVELAKAHALTASAIAAAVEMGEVAALRRTVDAGTALVAETARRTGRS